MNVLLSPVLLLAAQVAPPPARFVDLARTQDMARRCVRLDPSPAARARLARASTAANSVVTRPRASRQAEAVAQGQRDWSAMRDGVDTSCIVGPGETGRSAYADLLTDYETAIRAAGAGLSSNAKGR